MGLGQDREMTGIYASSGRHANSPGVMAVASGLAGAACAVVLWLNELDPESSIVADVQSYVRGGDFTEQLALLAVVFGAIAIFTAIAANVGGVPSTGTVLGLILGVIALSYPILSWLQITAGPIPAGVFG